MTSFVTLFAALYNSAKCPYVDTGYMCVRDLDSMATTHDAKPMSKPFQQYHQLSGMNVLVCQKLPLAFELHMNSNILD